MSDDAVSGVELSNPLLERRCLLQDIASPHTEPPPTVHALQVRGGRGNKADLLLPFLYDSCINFRKLSLEIPCDHPKAVLLNLRFPFIIKVWPTPLVVRPEHRHQASTLHLVVEQQVAFLLQAHPQLLVPLLQAHLLQQWRACPL